MVTVNCTKMIVSCLKNNQLPIVMSDLDYTNPDSKQQSQPKHESIGFIRSQTESYHYHLKIQKPRNTHRTKF